MTRLNYIKLRHVCLHIEKTIITTVRFVVTIQGSPYIFQLKKHPGTITKVTQNNEGMYTEEISQQTFEIPKNNLDVRFDKAY